MDLYKIEWKKSAIKELRNIHKEYIPKIVKAIECLSIDPYPYGVKKLSGSEKT